MPRLLDKLDAAVGLTPNQLDHPVDYLRLRPGPDRLIADDGTYNAGWYESFDGEINLRSSGAIDLAFQSWIHFGFETDRRFIVCNLADLTRGDNVAILVADKETGRFENGSLTRIFPRNSVQVSSDFLHYKDPATHSFVGISKDHAEFRFSVHAGDLHLAGVARQAIAPPLTQITRFQRYRGSLQRYGVVELVHGTLTMGEEVLALPAGTLGTYDHTVGHQRGLQAWNWLAAVGRATCEETGETAVLGVQVARDRPMARPQVDGRKHVAWLKGKIHKIPSAQFTYAYTDTGGKETGPWRIHSPERGERWLDLAFQPRFHRRERRYLWLVNTDFNQYYGELSGTVCIDGERWRLEEVFAVAEESLLEL